MRIVKVKVSDGEQGRGYSGDIIFDISGNYADDLYRTLDHEHPCTDDCCDIGAACAAGCIYSAAYLLSGATETPLLEKVVWAHRFNTPDSYNPFDCDFPPDWDDWIEQHKSTGRECAACGAWTYGDPDGFYVPEECGNCLAKFPEKSEEC